MTPLAKTVDEEGVLIDNFKLVEQGSFREDALIELLTDRPLSRPQPRPEHRRSQGPDRRQREGRGELRQDGGRASASTRSRPIWATFRTTRRKSVRARHRRLKDSEYEYPTDTGQVIRVKITVDREAREATVDFTGTSAAMDNNFNAPEPVARAAVLYCFRVMVEAPIPMNAGCLRPIRIVIPEGCMLKPVYPRAVVAGNVETSQHVTNAIFGALGTWRTARGR
jgi:5-oxoprolinase (ATP-hydrolysing)